MLNLSFNYYPIYVKNILASDIEKISMMLNSDDSIACIIESDSISTDKLRLRFLEYYISDDDFFLKVLYRSEIIGLIKGRVCTENSTAWISSFYIKNNHRRRGIAKFIYHEIESIVFNKYGISNMYVSTTPYNHNELLFWNNLGYRVNRVVNDFYEYYDRKLPMVMLNKKINIILY